jgi:citrate lyase beta subunit
MPGDSLRKIEKAAAWEVDSIIMDLEDGVAANQKLNARQTVIQAMTSLNFDQRERLIRINPLSTGLAEDDLTATIATRPDGYIVAKVELPEDLIEVTYWLDEAEKLSGWPADGIRLMAMIETGLGVMNLREICTASTRLDALIFGAEDFAASVGALRTRENWEMLYARSALVTAAGAYGLQAIDQVFVDLNDLAGLEAECVAARNLGFVGKTAIHPRQTPVINRAFAPTPVEVEQAQRLVDVFQQQQSAGSGAFAFEGKMVDMPMLRAAQRVLDRAGMVSIGS